MLICLAVIGSMLARQKKELEREEMCSLPSAEKEEAVRLKGLILEEA